jgi:hypothetical protein
MGEAAREACAVGHNSEAGLKIEKLMQLLSLATNLVAATPSLDHSVAGGLPDGSPNNGYSTAGSNSSSRVSPPIALPPGLVLPFQSDPSLARVSSVGSMKVDTADLGNHESRKRCASSVPIGDDRANKAPKREPLDDIIPLAQHTPPSANHTPPLLQSGNIFQSQQQQQHTAASVVDPRTVTVFSSSNILSQPPSRPPSPSKLIEGFSLVQQQPSQFSSPSKTPPQSDFDSNSSTPTATVSSFSTGLSNRASWSDGPPSMLPQRQHPHSRSSSSLVDLHGLGIPSYNPPTFGPSAMQPSQHSGVNTGGSISPPLGRVSRTGSVSNGFVSPFAFGFSDVTAAAAVAAAGVTPLGRPPPSVAPPTTVEAYDYSKSRPSTATIARRNSDTEEDYYDDSSDDEDGSSPSSRGYRSRPSTSHGGSSGQHSGADTNGSSHHRDDVPQEYREEVDRVFFEFMNKICSNRRSLAVF